MLKTKDQLKLELIYKVEHDLISRADAQLLLQVSNSTLKRYIKGYREKGIGFLRHGNCLRKPVNKTSDDIKQTTQKLIKEKYYDFNMLHGMQKVIEETGFNLKRETYRSWCHEIKMVKKQKRRRSKPRHHRNRMAQAGLMLQMDGSPHRWFNGQETCLIAVIDDATSQVIHGQFSQTETTVACLKVLKEVIRKKGCFKVLYVDKAGVFGGIKRNYFSQVERALGELGIQVIYAHSPEAKGRIERLFGTLQDRMIPEMRINKIRTMAQANDYIINSYLPHNHNVRFQVLATNPISAFIPVNNDKHLDDIFCIKEYRVVARDHTISFRGERYAIASEIRFSIYKQKVEIRFCEKGLTWKVYFANRELKVVKIQKCKAGGAAA